MITKVCTVFDKAVAAFMTPFNVRTIEEAKRSFMHAIENNDQIAANPRDYELYYLAEYNDATGEFGVPAEEKNSVPLRLMTGNEAVLANQQRQRYVTDDNA